MKYIISGNEVVEYEAEVEADSQEEAEEIFIQKVLPDLEPCDIHGWQWHETQILNKEINDE
jgi:hypothetical protein